MVQSTSISPNRRRLRTVRAVALCCVAAVLLWDGTAYAINAIVSQDLPILTEMAATEAASYLELGSILGEAVSMVKTAKEYTTIAKTAWGAVEELRHSSAGDLKDAALVGLRNAFPELGQIYGDVRDIRDLDYRNEQAVMTVRGLLWEEAYGPAIDYLHSAHANYEAIAQMREHSARSQAKIGARRFEAEQWEEDCKRTSEEQGVEGACQAGANRAAIQQALLLADLHETQLQALDAQERVITNQDRRELDDLYAYDRFMFDLRNYIAASSGVDTCVAGQCLYEQYGTKMYERINQFRARHPRVYSYRVPKDRFSLGGE